MNHDPEFTGTKLHRLILDIEGAVSQNVAGMTPLGAAVIRLCEEAWREWMESHAKKAKELEQQK